MRKVEISQTFSHGGKTLKGGSSFIMAEDIEGQYRNLYPKNVGMSYPIETIYKKYQGEELSNKKLMCWRTGGIGDILFLSPVLRYLKKKYPTSFIRVASGCKQSLENVPEIDGLYDMPFDAQLLEEVDYHLMFQGIIESSSEQSKKTHAVDMFFNYFGIDSTHLPAEDKKPRLFYTEEEMKWLEKTLTEIGIKKEDYVIGIQMETSAPLRNFPKEKMKAAIDIIAHEENVKIFVIGTELHNVIGNYYKGNNNNVYLATTYNVRQIMVFASRFNLVISPDTFMIQVAGALDKPLVGLYGPFPSEVRMKYFKNAIGLDPSVVCNPCFKHDFRTCVKGHPSPCFSQIKPNDILQAADYLKFKITGQHFKFMIEALKQPDLSKVEKYFLSADKGLCFFGGYYKHHNIITVDTNLFVKPDISDIGIEFKREHYPFVLYFGPIGFSPANKAVYENCKGLIRSGGYFIVHMMMGGVEQFFEEIKKDIGKNIIIMYSEYDPSNRSFTIVGRKPY